MPTSTRTSIGGNVSVIGQLRGFVITTPATVRILLGPVVKFPVNATCCLPRERSTQTQQVSRTYSKSNFCLDASIVASVLVPNHATCNFACTWSSKPAVFWASLCLLTKSSAPTGTRSVRVA